MKGSHPLSSLSVVSVVFLALFLWPLLLTAAQPVGDLTVEATGVGTSRQRALLDARRNAVEQGIGTVLVSQTEVQNFALRRDTVLTKTLGSVRRYTILEEQKGLDDLYNIRIQAVVSLANIKADLAALHILLESMDKPRMMVVVRERLGPTAATLIVDYLTSKGFDLVDPAFVAALMQKGTPQIRQILAGDHAAAAKLGSEHGAEYLLLGTVTTQLQRSALLSRQGMQSGRATVSAKIINCSTAQVITSKSAQEAAIHISADAAQSSAVEKATQKLMDQSLFETLVGSFQDMVNNGTLLAVTINNIANFRTQKAVRTTLLDLPSVVSIHGRRFSKGRLQMSVRFQGNAYTFGDTIDGISVSGRTLAVTDIVGNAVTVQLE